MDKLGRTHIHEWIRKRYQGKLNSQTRDSSIIVSTRKNDNMFVLNSLFTSFVFILDCY